MGLEIILAIVSVAAIGFAVDAYLYKKRKWGCNYKKGKKWK